MSDTTLADYFYVRRDLGDLEKIFSRFSDKKFKNLNEHDQFCEVSKVLLELIRSHQQSFLLDGILAYIQKVKEENVLEKFSFAAFEIYLNHFSGISEAENYYIRGKITGKHVPRDEFQNMFPIGMGKSYPGTHFVTAHSSPDLDTTIASFWGWVDAFTARVADGIHVWNVPGGPPVNQIEIDLLFKGIFGEQFFKYFSKKKNKLSVTSLDLMSQDGAIRKQAHDLALNFDHERAQNAVILVDEKGYYLGDWRAMDVEGVRQVIMSFNSCLNWLESFLHGKLISIFAKEQVEKKEIEEFIQKVLQHTFKDCDPAKEFTMRQEKYIESYLIQVLQIKSGMDASFKEFGKAMEELQIVDFSLFERSLTELKASSHFDENGFLIESRPVLFTLVEKIVKNLSTVFEQVQFYVEHLEVALKIKTDVFGFSPKSLSYRTDLDEIKSKIDSYPYLTVNYTNLEGKQIPLGIVKSAILRNNVLGTVTLRDFCNRDEVQIPPYLEVISVIDHHKSTLATTTPPTASISDAQSSNVAVAELAFQINDKFSTGGMDSKEIEKQIEERKKSVKTPSDMRILQRLLTKQLASHSSANFHIDPDREIVEYMHFLYGIIDDTDLLSKVSLRDVNCVCALLNRLKSLTLKQEVEIVDFDDIEVTGGYVRECAKKLLQNKDFYSIYSRIYEAKESAVEENIEKSLLGVASSTFVDTKVLNRFARIGQTKIFAKNYHYYFKHSHKLRQIFTENAQKIYQSNEEIDLHMHMISTVASAVEMYSGGKLDYSHEDELWIYVPTKENALDHLRMFLSAFKVEVEKFQGPCHVTFYGDNAGVLSLLFKESSLNIEAKVENMGFPWQY